MKFTSMILALASLAAVLPAQASHTPKILIYRFTGVHDSGGAAKVGQATLFTCKNWGAEQEAISFLVLGPTGTTMAVKNYIVFPRRTITVATHDIRVIAEFDLLSPGKRINGGSATITASHPTLWSCTGSVLEAATETLQSLDMDKQRFNAPTGAQE